MLISTRQNSIKNDCAPHEKYRFSAHTNDLFGCVHGASPRRIRNASKKDGLCNSHARKHKRALDHRFTSNRKNTAYLSLSWLLFCLNRFIFHSALYVFMFDFISYAFCFGLSSNEVLDFDVDEQGSERARERLCVLSFLPLKFETIISISSVFAKFTTPHIVQSLCYTPLARYSDD